MTSPDPAGAGSGEVVAAPFRQPVVTRTLRWGNTKPRRGDRSFRGLSEGSGVLIVVLITAIGLFLLWRAIPALARDKENFFTYGGNWVTTDTSAMHFGIFDLLQVTAFVALFALILAMPIALGIALTQYSPRRLAGIHGRPARSGPLDHVRGLGSGSGVWGLGSVHAGATATTARDVSQ